MSTTPIVPIKATEKQVHNHVKPGYSAKRSFSRQDSSSCAKEQDPSNNNNSIMTDHITTTIPQLPPGAVRKRNVFDVLEVLQKERVDGAEVKVPTVLIRVDFNVPMNQEGTITDDSRIRGALPTLQAILRENYNVVLMSHLGRPALVQAGQDDEATRRERQELSLRPVAEYLSALIHRPVLFAPDCMQAQDTLQEIPATGGGVCLLENLRFYKQEEKNDAKYAKVLAGYGDAYINDAFGTCHRAHASVSGVPAVLPAEKCGIGCLVASELAFLDFHHVGDQERIVAIIGGSKVSTKLPVIRGLINQVDTLILGGGLAFTFLKAKGIPIGTSLCEDGMLDTAQELLSEATAKGKKIVFPVDAVCAQEFPKKPNSVETQTFALRPGAGIQDGWMGLDVGPESVQLYREALSGATKVVFNGPMGVFEIPPFDVGTQGLVQVLEDVTKAGTVTVVGGGDSVAALEAFGKTEAVSYVSTGGGATLELLAGDILPGVAAIADYQ